jgi:hypothetical protein
LEEDLTAPSNQNWNANPFSCAKILHENGSERRRRQINAVGRSGFADRKFQDNPWR